MGDVTPNPSECIVFPISTAKIDTEAGTDGSAAAAAACAACAATADSGGGGGWRLAARLGSARGVVLWCGKFALVVVHWYGAALVRCTRTAKLLAKDWRHEVASRERSRARPGIVGVGWLTMRSDSPRYERVWRS